MGALKDVLEELKPKVTLLNITQLSEYRKDGHTSVYTERRGELLTRPDGESLKVQGQNQRWVFLFFVLSELRGEFGAGLLDLHSMDDSELLKEIEKGDLDLWSRVVGCGRRVNGGGGRVKVVVAMNGGGRV
ncbi:hypothetical protein QJS10_CPB18g00835 [Acorus calamus]|uniref:Trichome birefringence-like C-terminal domain-containing protein n=1 Tax=Acorus calamus TaxID=4465 RepID=A0AAV9CMA6_ACOCL|nr:hypothetical protein QJS10_CPB18g00835 [Acorus calamus]